MKDLCNDCDLGVTDYGTTEEGTCPWCEGPKQCPDCHTENFKDNFECFDCGATL